MNIKTQTAAKIVEAYREGTDIPALVEEHALTLLQVCRVIVTAGEALPKDLPIPTKDRKKRHVQRNREIAALRVAGFGYGDIGAEFSLSAARIADICREAKKADAPAEQPEAAEQVAA